MTSNTIWKQLARPLSTRCRVRRSTVLMVVALLALGNLYLDVRTPSAASTPPSTDLAPAATLATNPTDLTTSTTEPATTPTAVPSATSTPAPPTTTVRPNPTSTSTAGPGATGTSTPAVTPTTVAPG